MPMTICILTGFQCSSVSASSLLASVLIYGLSAYVSADCGLLFLFYSYIDCVFVSQQEIFVTHIKYQSHRSEISKSPVYGSALH